MNGQTVEILDSGVIVLTREAGRGGMSVVYEGRRLGCEGFEKRVAVKMLLSKWSENRPFLDLFLAEAKLVSDLVHENIVQIYQLGQVPGGAYYMVMEYVHGIPLSEFVAYHVQRGVQAPEPLAVHIASRIARGLAYAHAFQDRTGQPLRIVHRDVCPNNILITAEGLSKLTDFGVATAAKQTGISRNWLAGKVKYMSPEQAAVRAVDFRTDMYSLGAVLFEILSGKPIRPPDSDPAEQDFAKIPVPWDVLPARTGKDLVEILRRMLDPDPAKRFQDTGEAARALEYYIYRDGYGPTIQTVEAYLRKAFPHLYDYSLPKPAPAPRLPSDYPSDAPTLLDEATTGPAARDAPHHSSP